MSSSTTPTPKEVEVEGQVFSTQIEGRGGRDPRLRRAGKFKVKYSVPAKVGPPPVPTSEKTDTLLAKDVRLANNPHFFRLTGDNYSDVTINVTTDKGPQGIPGRRPADHRRPPPHRRVAGEDEPKELCQRQKACIDALEEYASVIKYPEEERTSPTRLSLEYLKLEKGIAIRSASWWRSPGRLPAPVHHRAPEMPPIGRRRLRLASGGGQHLLRQLPRATTSGAK